MSRKPVVVKVIEYLRDSGRAMSPAQIAEALGEHRDFVDAALKKLAGMNVISSQEDGYVYRPAPENDELIAKLVRVFEKLGEGTAGIELLVRSYVCQIPPQHLFHLPTLLRILEREGLDRDIVLLFLEQEARRGYVRRTSIVYTGLMSPQLFPVCTTPYHFNRLRRLAAVEASEHSHFLEPDGRGPREEDYLVARYPFEIASQARQYATAEGRDLTAALRHMGVMGRNGWWWQNRVPANGR